MNDTKITQLLSTDSRAAVELILPQYGPALQGVIFKIVGSREVAEEVLQDTFIKVWKKADNYDASKGRLFTWLINIARNTAIDRLRSKKYKDTKKSDSLDDNVYDNVAFSEEMHPQDVGLQKVIGQLDEKYRLLIDLLYLQGYTQQEASKELDIPLGTVKSRSRIALRELRAILSKTDNIYMVLLLERVIESLSKF